MEQYKYFAFVSYRSSDEKWAKWLQEKIEAYRLPTTVQRMNGALPKSRLRPCFRYHTDIQPNELKTELRQKLEQSRYLLVICTPRSAQSPWVGAEIDTFVELGRRDRIIPVIVEGRPYSGDPETECFNPSLLKHFPHSDNIDEDREILGVNINEEGAGSRYMKRERAVIQVVSRMLGVNFDQLWQRQRRRIRRRIALWTVGSLLVAGALIGTWLLNQPFSARVALTESTPEVAALPPLQNAVLTLRVGDEERTDTIADLRSEAVFRYLPARLKGKETAVRVEAYGYRTLDTTVVLCESLSLPLQRDENLFGNLSAFVLMEGDLCPNLPIRVEQIETRTDQNGRFRLFIPLPQQQREYRVSTLDNRHQGILHAPCGQNDIVEL